MVDKLSIFTGVLIFAGGVIMLLATLSTGKILDEVKAEQYHRNWKILRGLMIFFLCGYLASVYIVVSGGRETFFIITGVVFFFGALFVYIVVRTGFYTIRDLGKTVEDHEKEILRRQQLENELKLNRDRLDKQNSALLFLAKNIQVKKSDLRTAIKQITEKTCETMDLERVSIWLFDEQKTSLKCFDLYERSKKTHGDGVILNAGDFPSYFQALEEERVISAADAYKDKRTAEFSQSHLIPLGISSIMNAPIRIEGKMKGVISYEQVGPQRNWTVEEQSFVSSLADMVSLVIETFELSNAEKELELSVSLMRATIESTADGILVVDNGGKITGFNQQFVKMWKIPDEIIATKDDAKTVARVLDQLTEPDVFVSKVKELYTNPKQESFDILNFKDGRVFERYSKPQFAFGEIVGRVWSFRDISDRKRWEEEIRKLNAELESRVQRRTAEVYDLYNNAPTGYHSLDREGRFTKINDTELKLLGYSRSEMIGKKITEFLTEAGKKIFEENFPLLQSRGWLKDVEITFNRKDGSPATMFISSYAVKDKDGNFSEARTSMFDITEKKKLEEALRASEIKYRTMIEAAGDVVYTTDTSGNFTFISQRAFGLTGYKPEEFIGKNFTELIAPAWKEKVRAFYYDQFKNRIKETLYSFPILTKSGEEKWVEQTVTQLKEGTRVIGHQSIVRDITERIKMDEKLKESEESYRSLSENSPVLITRVNGKGEIEYINKVGTAFSRDEVIGSSLFNFIPENSVDLFREKVNEVFTSGKVEEFETDAFRVDTKTGWYSNRIAPVMKGNEIISAIIISSDITEKKKADEQIQVFEDIVRNIPLGLVIFQFENINDKRSLKLTLANPAAEKSIFVNAPELVGKYVVDFSQDIYESGKDKIYQEIVRTGQPKDLGVQHYRASEKVPGNYFHLVGFPLPGNAVGLSIENVTERVLAEQKIIESEARYRSLAENAPVFIITVNKEAKIEYMNRSGLLLGQTDVFGAPLYNFVHKNALEIYRTKLNEVFSSGKPTSFEAQGYKADGTIGWYSTMIAPIKTAGQITSAIIISSDITERIVAEEKIKNLNEDLKKNVSELEIANKELESFSYSVSHDLRTPLRAIDGFTNILEQKYKDMLDAEGKRYMDIISGNAQKMGQLIDDLLAFSRLGKKELQKTVVDCQNLLNTLLKDIDIKMWNPKAKIVVKEIRPAFGDSLLLKQVLFNLITNALKYSRTAENPEIEIGSYPEGNENIYYVKDNGAGFDMEYYNKLFKVFQRLHSSEEFEGLGVGLAIVHRIVTRHGGRVWAEGKVNKGATFYFSLPVVESKTKKNDTAKPN